MPDPYAFWVAFYAAIVATAVAAWDIAKWKMQGPRLRVRIRGDMREVNRDGRWGVPYVVIDITNRGDRATTVTHLILNQYANDWQAFANPKSTLYQGVVPRPENAKPLPFLLAPGEQWTGMILQSPPLEKMAREGYLLIGVNHTHSEKAVMKPLKLEPKTQP